MTAQATPTTLSARVCPAGAAAPSTVPAPAPGPAVRAAAPAASSVPVRRARRALGVLLARRARPKRAAVWAAPAAEGVPSAPDVWLAGLRLGG
ncbi:hypothetical protein ACFXAW_05545 [Streptomyces sp. NPDC059445]|uniref:hypothetical protein n=1 Tax=Streptomyces sp. NPDC059445 TaxID=3346832 RepID=UPI003696E77F